MQCLRVLDRNTILRDRSRWLPRLIGEDIEIIFIPDRDLGRVRLDPVQGAKFARPSQNGRAANAAAGQKLSRCPALSFPYNLALRTLA